MLTLIAALTALPVPLPPDGDRAGQAEAVMQAYFESGAFEGSALLGVGDEVVYAGGVGLANREWSIPNDADTKFRIASITKQFTAMLVFQLVADGALDLDGTVSEYLPYYREDTGARITIGLMLQHRSGLAEMPLTSASLPEAAALVDADVPAFIRTYCSGNLVFEPGTQFSYCNAEFNVLGAIIEEVTGQSFEAVLRAQILDPLGMSDTGLARADAVLPRFATGYDRAADGSVTRDTLDHWQVTFAAAGMYSTPRDLFRWTRAVMEHRLLPASWTRTMFTPRDDIGVEGNYVAYGSWVYPRALPGADGLRPRLIERRGFIRPYTMLVVMAPEQEISLILMSNTNPATIHELPYANGLPLDLLLIGCGRDPIGP